MKELQPEELQYILKARGLEDETYELQHAPTAWEESSVLWKRSLEYWGMMRDFTLPLDFVYEGARIIRNEFYGFGYESQLQIFINRLNPKTWKYLSAYVGDLDLTTFNDKDNTVTVNAAEGGISARIKAYEGVDYEIDIDVQEVVEIELEPVKLQEKTVFIFPLDTVADADYFPNMNIVDGASEIKSQQKSTQSVVYFKQTDPDFYTSDKWFLNTVTEGKVISTYRDTGVEDERTGFLDVRLYVKPNTTYDISIYSSLGNKVKEVYHEFWGEATGGEYLLSLDLSFEYDAVGNERFFLYFDSSRDGDANVDGFQVLNGLMEIKYFTVTPATKIKALRPIYVFQQLINKINGTPFEIRSAFLKRWEQVLITSGDAVRGIVGAKVKTNLKDFFRAFNTIESASFGIQNNIATFESREYWFNSTVRTFVFDNISNFNLNVNTDLLYSSVVVGYEDQTYDEINGKQEVNSNQTWTLPITRVQKQLELISPYRADAYGIEFLRINLEGKNTTDSDSDNDVCMIKVEKEPVTGQNYCHVERFPQLLNVLAGETWYNADLTPKRCLLRQGAYLKSILYKRDGYNIEFQSGLKNTSAITLDNNGVRVVENEDINVASLPKPFFIPYVVSFDAPIKNEAQSQIDLFPTGRVDFMYKGNKFSGYILEMPVNIAKNTVQNIKLLLTADSDLGLLAR